MLGPITWAVEKRGSSTVNVRSSRIAARTRSCRVTSQPSRHGSHDTGSCSRSRAWTGCGSRSSCSERHLRAERKHTWHSTHSDGGRLAAELDQVAHEGRPVALGRKRIEAIAQQHRHPLEIEQQRQLARRVVPLARVVAVGPGRERGQRLELHLVLPPARPNREPVALAQRADVGPQPLEPQPTLPRVQAAPGQRPADVLVERDSSPSRRPEDSSSPSPGGIVGPPPGARRPAHVITSPAFATGGRRTTSAAGPGPAPGARRPAARGARGAGATPRAPPAAAADRAGPCPAAGAGRPAQLACLLVAGEPREVAQRVKVGDTRQQHPRPVTVDDRLGLAP